MNPEFEKFDLPKTGKLNPFIPIIVLWGVAAAITFGYFVFDESFTKTLGQYYLIPWALIAGLIVLSPSFYYLYKGTFDLFHPLVFGVWSYIFPAFILGAFIITFDMTNEYVLQYVTDPTYNIPLSLVYVVLGYAGLVIGFYLPISKYVIGKVEHLMPKSKWDNDNVWLSGIMLIFFGLALNIIGVLQGLLGFQRIDEVGMFDSLVVFLTMVFTVGYVLLWLGVFTTKRRTGAFYLVILLLLFLIPLKLALQGGRSSLMLSVIPIAMAFWYSGRRLKWQHGAIFGAILFLAIIIGVIYGTSFRRIKGSEERINAGDFVGQIAETLNYLSRRDSGAILFDGSKDLAERVENLSSLGVVVANYERLEPYEESYGLKNNILNDLSTSLIPRFAWSDKPNTSDARAYSELYLNYGENSFAITPFGDLLRNFGILGIPLGMMILGFYLRLIYSSLIDTEEPRMWKKVAYFPLLSLVSYESFYGLFIPTAIRVGLIVTVSLLIASLFVRKIR